MFTPDSVLGNPTSLLGKEVATRNLVNKTANEVQMEIQKLLLPLVGKKILKVTPYRSATKKVKELLNPIQDRLQAHGFRLVFDWNYSHTVYATLDTTYQATEHGCNYVKKEIYICSIVDFDLLSGEWRESEPGRTDYTEQEVIATRQEMARLDAMVSELKSKMREFSR